MSHLNKRNLPILNTSGLPAVNLFSPLAVRDGSKESLRTAYGWKVLTKILKQFESLFRNSFQPILFCSTDRYTLFSPNFVISEVKRRLEVKEDTGK